MANKAVSALTAAATLVGTELLHLVQGGNSRKGTVQQLIDMVGGVDMAVNRVAFWNPAGNGNTAQAFGMPVPTLVGTATTRNVANTNLFTRQKRDGRTASNAANNVQSFRFVDASYTLGDGAGLGGFKMVCHFGRSVVKSDDRFVVAMMSNSGAIASGEPSALTNLIGVGCGTADTNLKIFYGGSSAQTPIDLGANFPAKVANTDWYRFELECFGTDLRQIRYRVTRLNTGDVAEGTLSGTTAQVPADSTFLCFNSMLENVASGGAGPSIDMGQLTLSTVV